ncbi:LysR substrate-binding domain-containing protein [Novispirillum sp. DQ9]|uniref:LysR family transcriptional regulator n=1 Tax=Novispirillum sp. DQ9 TaxID=3398612 RepID=UPI003C7B1420
MQHPTVHQLRIFEAIVRHGGFSRAAEALHLTQPTVSMQIRKVAESVGLPLFEQTGRRLELTEAGHALLRLARETFDGLDRFDQTIAELKGLRSGRLRLAAVTSAEYFLPRLLGPFCNRYPGIEVALEVGNRERILGRLRAGTDDLYVFGQPPEDADVIARPFLENPLVVVAPAGHPLAGQAAVPLARLAEEPFLLREAGSGTRTAAERAFRDAGSALRLRMELGSNEAIKQGVLGGLGLGVLSRHAVTGAPGLVELDVAGFPIRRQWFLVWPAGRPLSPAARALADHLLAVTQG